MRDPAMRECRCETCGHVDWVGGPLVPTRGIVCDVCRRTPCPECEGPMRPTHPGLLADFEKGVTNAPAPATTEAA